MGVRRRRQSYIIEMGNVTHPFSHIIRLTVFISLLLILSLDLVHLNSLQEGPILKAPVLAMAEPTSLDATGCVRLPRKTGRPKGGLKRVAILGLFDLTTKNGIRTEGLSELAAARLAVKHVNQEGVLPGYRLMLVYNDTRCDAGVGVDAFFHALYNRGRFVPTASLYETTVQRNKNPSLVMLLGTACDHVTQSLAKVVPYWNMVQVSFGSTTPALSDRREYPLFYRTVAPDSSHNPARSAFIHHCGWDTITALSQDEDIYSLAVNDLVTQLEQVNITCRATITFAKSHFKEQLKNLRDLDTRIIIGSFSQEVAPKIFCEAYHLRMYGADYAWILPLTSFDWNLNNTLCTPHELATATEGLLMVSNHNTIVGLRPPYSGSTNSRFLSEFATFPLPVTRYSPQTYDAVWAISLALRGAQNTWSSQGKADVDIENFHYGRHDMAQEFFTQVGKLNFSGVSGPVSFSGADRVGISAFHQIQKGVVRKVALFYPWSGDLDFNCPNCFALVWPGGQIPVAKRVFKIKIVSINPLAFGIICFLSTLGILLALALLAFNLHFRKLKSIKLSSPQLNNMTVVGCILVYIAVILLGLDDATLPARASFHAVCTARVYLFSGGFSMAFGSMFTKTYRVHRIFTRSRGNEVVKEKLLQDRQLISLVCCLLMIDVIIATTWLVVDPIQRHLRNLTLENSTTDRTVVYQPQVEVCQSHYTQVWLGILYIYKGLLLLVGVYMAWETRHVTIPALNDSQNIGISVYSVVITSAFVVLLANLIAEHATVAFLTITTLILTSTSSTLFLLFMPKLPAIFGQMDHTDPIVESMGLKIECNTRRFVTDDRRELYYRVEVQNRAYRRELTELGLEIERLNRQLQSPTESSNSVFLTEITPKEDESQLGGVLVSGVFSTLQPLVPRGSWPHAGNTRTPLAFSSQLNLDEDSEEEDTTKKGVPKPFRSLLGSISSRCKLSAPFTNNAKGLVAVPAQVPENVSKYMYADPPGSRNKVILSTIYPEKKIGRVQSGPIMINPGEDENVHLKMVNKRKFSLTASLEQEEKRKCGNWAIIPSGLSKITHQRSQPILSLQKVICESPRLSNNTVPTKSLNDLDDEYERDSTNSPHGFSGAPQGSSGFEAVKNNRHGSDKVEDNLD